MAAEQQSQQKEGDRKVQWLGLCSTCARVQILSTSLKDLTLASYVSLSVPVSPPVKQGNIFEGLCYIKT